MDYAIGQKIETKVGGKWWPGEITGEMNKAGNYPVKFTANGKTQRYVSSPDQIRIKNSSGKYKVVEQSSGKMNFFLVTDGKMNAGRYTDKTQAQKRADALNKGEESPWQKTQDGQVVNSLPKGYEIIRLGPGSYKINKDGVTVGLEGDQVKAELFAKQHAEGKFQNAIDVKPGDRVWFRKTGDRSATETPGQVIKVGSLITVADEQGNKHEVAKSDIYKLQNSAFLNGRAKAEAEIKEKVK